MIISPAQCRAARGLLNWTQSDLADRAKVSRATVTSFEAEKRTPIENNLMAITAALQAAGLELINEGAGGAGAGVRFRSRPDPYAHFPFPIFDFTMPFGPGRFGVYRDPSESFNKWSRLTLLQLANPHRVLDYRNYTSFWHETLNSGTTVKDVLTRALEAVEGPRKPDRPSDLTWYFYQPENVYPEAEEFSAELIIDWRATPPQIRSGAPAAELQFFTSPGEMPMPPNGLDWWRLDQPSA